MCFETATCIAPAAYASARVPASQYSFTSIADCLQHCRSARVSWTGRRRNCRTAAHSSATQLPIAAGAAAALRRRACARATPAGQGSTAACRPWDAWTGSLGAARAASRMRAALAVPQVSVFDPENVGRGSIITFTCIAYSRYNEHEVSRAGRARPLVRQCSVAYAICHRKVQVHESGRPLIEASTTTLSRNGKAMDP